VKKELESLLKEISPVNPLKEYEERLDNVHLHVFLLRVKRHRFPSLFLMMDVSGRKLLNLSVEDPFDREPCIYRVSADVPDTLLSFYRKHFKEVDSVSSGIFRMPLRVKVLRSVGDETWLQKIFLQEKVRGEEFFLFQERVSEKDLKKLFDLLNSELKLILRNEGIDVFLDLPDWVEKDHVPLLHEIGVLLRKKENIQPAQNPEERTFLSLRIGYDRFFEEEFDLVSFVGDFLKKLKKIYKVTISML